MIGGPPLALVLSTVAWGGDDALIAVRTAVPPVIDGRLDDAVWQVPAGGPFTQREPDDGAEPTERTELRVLYDDDALYIGVWCFDRDPAGIVERLTRRDRDTDADKIEVDLSPRNDGESAYLFRVNAAGVEMDGVRYNDTELGFEWDGLWTADVSRDGSGWGAELRIPLATLRIEGSAPVLGLQVRRFLQRRQEVDEWAHIPATTSGEVAHYGALLGLSEIPPVRPLTVTPYVSTELTSRSGQGTGDGVTPGARIGGDLTVGLGRGLTADLTVNPDFGQVEADQVVFNLTTFENFLPEKRPFFLSGYGIFQTPFEQFYSRRIGRAPPAPSDPLAEPLPEGRIWTAGKLTGTVAEDLSLGVFSAVTAQRSVDVLTDDGGVSSRLVDPTAYFEVLRLQQEFGANSAVGVMVTAVTRAEEHGAMVETVGALCPDDSVAGADLRCTHDAYTAGVDVRLRSADGEWGATAHLVGSVLANGSTRYVPDGTTLGPGDAGWGFQANVGRYGGEHWLYEVIYLGTSPKLDLNDAGALQQGNLHRLQPVLTWRDTRAGKHLLYREIQADGFVLQSWDGVPLRRALELNTTLQFRNFYQVLLETVWDGPSQDNRELRDGARLERGPIAWFGGTLSSDPRGIVVLDVSGGLDVRSSVASNLDVPVVEADATIGLRPASAIEVDLIGSSYVNLGEPRWVETTLFPGRAKDYLVADLTARSFDVTVRGTWALARRVSLQAYTQLFAFAADFGSGYTAGAVGSEAVVLRADFVPTGPVDLGFREAAVNTSVLLRWDLSPGSAFTLFYGRSQLQAPVSPDASGFALQDLSGGPATDVVLAKLSVLFDPSGRAR